MRVVRTVLSPCFVLCCLTALRTSAAAQTYWVQSADYGSGNRRQDVTQTVRRLVSGPNFKVNNQTLGGDPYVEPDKVLRIVGRDAQGNARDFRYGETAMVNTSIVNYSWQGDVRQTLQVEGEMLNLP